MAILDMTKFSLSFFAKDREKLTQKLQAFDWVNFNDPTEEDSLIGLKSPDNSRLISINNTDMTAMDEAIKILKEYESGKKSFKEKFSNRLPQTQISELHKLVEKEDPQKAVKDCLELSEKIRKSEETVKKLKEEKRELESWKKLDIPLSMLDKPGKVKAVLGTIPNRWAEEARLFLVKEAKSTYIEFIRADDKSQYVMILTDGRDKGLDDMLRDVNFNKVNFAEKGTIKEGMEEKDRLIHEQERNIVQYKLSLKKLYEEKFFAIQAGYEIASYEKARLEAEGKLMESEQVCFLEGYVPSEKFPSFRKIIGETLENSRYSLDAQAADRNDPDVPIILKNNNVLEPFEDLVETYSLPLYKEMDPTPLMAPWYMFFFGTMMGDLGYGLVMLLGTTLALSYFNFSDKTKKSLRFFRILSIPTILAGLAFGSIFGGLIPMKPLIIDPTNDIMPMIVFSVVLGIIHIFVALAISGVQKIREGEPVAVLYDVVSWYLLIGGLILGGLAKALNWQPMVANIGFIGAIVGAVLIVFFSARDEKTTFSRIAWGFYNLYGATSYIGDFASYTRVTALMLSGAYIGFSFNLIASMIGGGGILSLIVRAVLLIFLHAFNLFLSGLSGYVHSMRLIYVEFFGKFYEGGGKKFKKLRPEGKYIDIK